MLTISSLPFTSLTHLQFAGARGLTLDLAGGAAGDEGADADLFGERAPTPLSNEEECRSVGAGVVRLLQRLAQDNWGASLWGQHSPAEEDAAPLASPASPKNPHGAPTEWAVSPRESGGSFGYARQRRLLVRNWSAQMPPPAPDAEVGATLDAPRAGAPWSETGVALLNGGCQVRSFLLFASILLFAPKYSFVCSLFFVWCF